MNSFHVALVVIAAWVPRRKGTRLIALGQALMALNLSSWEWCWKGGTWWHFECCQRNLNQEANLQAYSVYWKTLVLSGGHAAQVQGGLWCLA